VQSQVADGRKGSHSRHRYVCHARPNHAQNLFAPGLLNEKALTAVTGILSRSEPHNQYFLESGEKK
jgi:hypothetical protein